MKFAYMFFKRDNEGAYNIRRKKRTGRIICVLKILSRKRRRREKILSSRMLLSRTLKEGLRSKFVSRILQAWADLGWSVLSHVSLWLPWFILSVVATPSNCCDRWWTQKMRGFHPLILFSPVVTLNHKAYSTDKPFDLFRRLRLFTSALSQNIVRESLRVSFNECRCGQNCLSVSEESGARGSQYNGSPALQRFRRFEVLLTKGVRSCSGGGRTLLIRRRKEALTTD